MSVRAAVGDLQIPDHIFTIQHLHIVYGVVSFQRLKMYEQLKQSVIELHDIARLVEQEIGQGQLSLDLRDCADKLALLIKLDVEVNSNA